MNTSLGSKDTALLTALQAPFEGDTHARMVELIYLFITALCKERTNNPDRSAREFELKSNNFNFLPCR